MKSETSEIITKEIQELVKKQVYIKDNKEMIALPNSRLDFCNKYLFKGFTRKGVKLSWINGNKEIKVIGKVWKRPNGDLKLVTDGWNYILKIKKGDEE